MNLVGSRRERGPSSRVGRPGGRCAGPNGKGLGGDCGFYSVCRAKPRRQVGGGSAIWNPFGLGMAQSMP